MDDIKLLGNPNTGSEDILHSEVIGMEFGREKLDMLIMKSGKCQMTEGKELPNQEKIRMLGNIRSKYYQTSRDERKKIKNEYLWRTRKLLQTKL